jgi:hypothetical protein
VITLSIDLPSATLVVIDNAGPGTRDIEYERTLDALSLVTQRRSGIMPAIVIFIDPGRPVPDARWRRRFAHERAGAGPFRCAMVTSSVTHRGLMTAVDWIRPPGAEQRMLAFPTLTSARAWLELECNRTLEPLLRLYHEARRLAIQQAAQRL